MRRLFFFALLLTFPCFSADGDLREYRFVRGAGSDGVPSGIIAIPFDNALYRHTDDGYSNILVVDPDGAVVPFAVRTAREKKEVEAVTRFDGKITFFSRNDADNSASVEFTLPEEKVICALEFATKLSRFDKKVSIDFFDGAGNTVRRDRELKLFKYDGLFGDSSVEFAPVRAKKMRITLHGFSEKRESPYSAEKTGRLDRVTVKSARAEEFRFLKIAAVAKEKQKRFGERKYVAVDLPELGRRTTEKGDTVIEIDACRVPVSGLVFRADDERYSRPAKLQMAGAGGKILSLAAFEVGNAEKKIPLGEKRCEKFILTVMNGDDAPLRNIRLEWSAPERMLVARSRGGKDLKIYYGGNAPKRHYDIEKYADELLLSGCSFYTLGREEPAPAFSPALPREKILKGVMWAVVILASAVMLAVIVKLLAFSPPPEPPAD